MTRADQSYRGQYDQDRTGAGPSVAADEVRRLAGELSDLCTETETALEDLRRIVSRYQELQQDSAAVQAHIAAIRSSNSWRVVELLRRARGALRLASPSRLDARLVSRRRRVSRFVRTSAPGVNVAGYLDTESGMGEAARASIRSLEAAGIPYALNNVASRLRKHDRTYAHAFVDDNPYPFNLVHLNADNMGWFAAERGRRYFRKRYTIGYWFWELAAFPQQWRPFFEHVDEVWAASEFMRACYAEWSPVPVRVMPLPVVLPPIPALGRAHFGIPDDRYAFLYMFDVSSQMERKNPLGAIEAFRRAGFRRGQALLVLKFTNAEYDRAAVERLVDAAAGLDVHLLDGYMERAEVCALLASADCYFSPHRSEGFGLTILEAMRLGKPVIATAYSGNVDFMTSDNSYPLSFSMTALQQNYGPYMRGAVWADPDLDEAARHLRHVFEHRAEACERGRRAQREVMEQRDPQVTGERLRHRLDEIRFAEAHGQNGGHGQGTSRGHQAAERR